MEHLVHDLAESNLKLTRRVCDDQMYRQLARLSRGAYACAASKGTERGGACAVIRGAVGGFVCGPQSVRRFALPSYFLFSVS